MTTLAWDQPGEKNYETGVDRGVLYLPDTRVVPWNGLTGVSDTTDRESDSFYMDGVKFLERQVRGDFKATLKAFTYPDEFDEVNGNLEFAPGMTLHGHLPKAFDLSYRTLLGNDLEGTDRGYRIHIFYNVLATPTIGDYATMSDSAKPVEFSWTLSATPKVVYGYGPTTHVSLDSTEIVQRRLRAVEEIIYGTDETDPWLPDVEVLKIILTADYEVLIIDLGDGRWAAVDISHFQTHLSFTEDPTEFQLIDVNALYLSATTYQVSDTP
jgi:hypothetical protein